MRQGMDKEVKSNLWMMVGAIERPRDHGCKAEKRKVQRAIDMWGYTWDEIMDASREAYRVEARMIIAKYLRDKKWTLKAIGNYMGGRDHATALYNIKKCEDFIHTERDFRAKYYQFLNA